jgi:hypothetical protein
MELKKSNVVKELAELIPVYNTTAVRIASLYIRLEQDKNNEATKILLNDAIELFKKMELRKVSLENELDHL